MPNFVDLTGHTYGRWTVIRRDANKGPITSWLCRCECGTERVVRGCSLRTGKSVSCGCYVRELNTVHGLAGTKTNSSWRSMMLRCHDPADDSYARYGGAGIRVCAEWHDFRRFAADMGLCPPGHQIDRIDNSKGYEPSNCRWVTVKQQQNNRSSNRRITFRGETLTMQQWTERLGFKKTLIKDRLEHGWSVERALTVSPALYRAGR